MKLPIVYENSRVPIWLSKISPIKVFAVSFAFWVWCRESIPERTLRHETIHFRQQVELLFVFQWILYGLSYLIGLVRYRNGEKAYRENWFEREAYSHDRDPSYLETRKFLAWLRE